MAARPTGRDEVMAAVIDAAVPLLAERGPSGVTTRDIAQAANVNHALVYRHFGSKEGLIRAVLAESGRMVSKARTIEEVAAHRVYVKLLARLVLDSGDRALELSEFPVLRGLLGDPAELDAERRTDMVLAASLFMGWMLFEDYLLAGVGGGEVERQAVRDRLPELMSRSMAS